MRFSPRDRVMIVAPHPDDETLGAGGLLVRAAAARAAVRVVFVTDGENNPWPQRILERRLRIGATERARWGARRRREGLAALHALGVDAECAVFLALPDQGLTTLLAHEPARAIHRLRDEIEAWRPTLLVCPSARDRHPDHSAVAVLLSAVLAAVVQPPVALTYVIHPLRASGPTDAVELPLTSEEHARKRAAVEQHASQLVFHRRSYRAAALATERFALWSAPPAAAGRPIVQDVRVRDEALHIALRRARVSLLPLSLVIVGFDGERPIALRVRGPCRRRVVSVDDLVSGSMTGEVRWRRSRRRWWIAVPMPASASRGAIFVKPFARARFFDPEGWYAVSSAARVGSDCPRASGPRAVAGVRGGTPLR